MKFFGALSLLAGVATAAAAPAPGGIGFSVGKVSSYKEVASSNSSRVYEAVVPDYPDPNPIHVVVLEGTRYQMGYDYGRMAQATMFKTYNNLLNKILGTGLKADAERLVLEAFLDFQWRNHLSKQVPAAYIDEMRGLTDGARDGGATEDAGRVNQRIIVLSNFPSDTSELIIVLTNEFLHGGMDGGRVIDIGGGRATARELLESALRKVTSLQCSMFAAWGDRVQGGTLLSARNLDWLSRSGINQGKSVTVFRPSGPSVPSAVFGYTGLMGALAGMNPYMSVHEANLEETKDTFDGFPFVLRLRYVMETSTNIAGAIEAMKNTNSTVGFNHMAASAADVGKAASPAIAWETMAGYEAAFGADDPRERGATWVNPKTNLTEQIGYTLDNALYRTNHGYDPVIRSDYVWNLASGAGKSSLHRYMQIYEGVNALTGTPMSTLQAINITASAGSKGGDNTRCDPAQYESASNVLSVTFRPADQVAYASWETGGPGNDWVPAACAMYVEFDLSSFFATGKPPSANQASVTVRSRKN